MAANVLRLHLLRHAKSSWAEERVPDRDRPLSGRGRRTCALLATHIASEHIAPDLVLASPARRVAETLEGIGHAFRPDTPIWTEPRLYTDDADDLVAVIADIPAEVRCLLVVGHNPAIEDLARTLLDDRTSEAAVALLKKYPTGALATFDLRGTWKGLTRSRSRLVSFVRPRDLASP